MRVLFAVSHAGFLRNFESGLRALLARGHEVHVLFGKAPDAESVGGSALQVLDRIRDTGGVLTHAVAPRLEHEWAALGAQLRMTRDYWRYLAADYADAPLLRGRARDEAPGFAVRIADSALFASALVRRIADRVVH